MTLNTGENRDYHVANPPLAFGMTHLSHKPTILIIDDETDICYLLSSILRQKDIQPVIASSLSEADHIIEDSTEFSFIFLDNHLPDGLGVNYIKQIKKKIPLCKVIMITAHDNVADREIANYEGADYFIGKPFSRESILKTLDRFVV